MDCLEKKLETPSSNTTGTKKFNRNCRYCGEKGHKEVECCKKKRDSEAGNDCEEVGTSEVMLCRFCKDSNTYKVDSMY